MLKNHLLFTVRLFKKERFYATLNLLGLTLGIVVGIVLFLFLQHEFGYDKHFTKHSQIYRFTAHLKSPGPEFNTALTSRRLAPIIKEDLPEVLNYVRFLQSQEVLVSSEGAADVKRFYEESVFFADSSFSAVFDHHFYEGNPETCLQGVGKAVITQSIKEKYFGNETALGRKLQLNNEEWREVSAVISDLPSNTHLKYDILLSHIPTIDWDKGGTAERTSEVFWNPNAYTYLLMPKDYDTGRFYEKFPLIYEKTFGLFGKRINGSAEPELQRIDQIHFHSDKNGDFPTGNIRYVYTFMAIGVFIIALACINYMNLATARSATRTNEMGVRKALGNTRLGLFRDVMVEAMTMSFAAMALAILTTWLLLEFSTFNHLIGKELSLSFTNNPPLIFGTLGITIVIGLLSGSYPALYIPSVSLVSALKGTFTGDKDSGLVRKVLITVQFAISLFVIICTVLMKEQVHYVHNKDLGFNTDQTLLINVRDSVVETQMKAIKNELLNNPNIVGITNSYNVPGQMQMGGTVMLVEKDSSMAQQLMSLLYVGEEFIDLLQVDIVQGRGFDENRKSDYGNAILVNEAGASAFGWGQEAVGKNVRYFHGERDMKIVGVFKDFNFQSLHNPINPLFIVLDEGNGGTCYVKVKGEHVAESVDFIQKIWTQFDTDHPFHYRFLDDVFAKLYEEEKTQMRLISLLSYLSIIISLLGLIGLSAFTTSQRAKEISIRKVLGAKTSTLVFLFNKSYMVLILLAFGLAVPFADYVIVEWMAGFAYQMPINWWHFAWPGLLVFLLGISTVSIQSLKFTKANPVEGLRSE